MSRLGIFIADGCEEVEALTVVDIVRRAKLEIDMISINGTKQVTSSRNVTFMTHDGHEAGADLLLTDQMNVCCLDHGIGCFDSADQVLSGKK